MYDYKYFFASKKNSVEDWVCSAQFWSWTPPFPVFLPRNYHSACESVRGSSNIKPFKVQRNNARDADPHPKVHCNAGMQARQLRWTYLARKEAPTQGPFITVANKNFLHVYIYIYMYHVMCMHARA